MNGFSEFNREKTNNYNRSNGTTMTAATILTTTTGNGCEKPTTSSISMRENHYEKKTPLRMLILHTKAAPREGESVKLKIERELVKWLSEKLKNIFVGV